ncbi:hypothetical protein [Flavobacterium sp.]|uniref:hypothetical protein n=1 Tax=Flavobacterium sp. TaxID=239 RepID=UPI0039E3C1BB
MKVHSLMLFENGTYTEISKEFDLSAHNWVRSPETHHLVEDNYMTFFYPEHLDKEVVYDYAQAHRMHLIEGWELIQAKGGEGTDEKAFFQGFPGTSPFPEGYKMYHIHYWTEQPTHWELNPEADLFVFNSQKIQTMVLFN